MAKNRKDSFDFFLATERNKHSAFEENEEWKLMAAEMSPKVNKPKVVEKSLQLGKRASSEDRDLDLDSTENSYNIMSFLVKYLLSKGKSSLDDLVASAVSAYSAMGGHSHLKSKTVLKRKVKECLSQTTLFWCDSDKKWQLADKQAAVDHVMGMKDSLSKRSETTLSHMAENNHETDRPKPKRRYRRDKAKYHTIMKSLDSICEEYALVLKNPFAGITESTSREDTLRMLGSSEKILGIVQCYNYFAPLIQSGMKKLSQKESTMLINTNILQVTNTLAELAVKIKQQGQIGSSGINSGLNPEESDKDGGR